MKELRMDTAPQGFKMPPIVILILFGVVCFGIYLSTPEPLPVKALVSPNRYWLSANVRLEQNGESIWHIANMNGYDVNVVRARTNTEWPEPEVVPPNESLQLEEVTEDDTFILFVDDLYVGSLSTKMPAQEDQPRPRVGPS
jgi:hypothetical protein